MPHNAALLADLGSLPLESDPSYGIVIRRILRDHSPTDDVLTAITDDASQTDHIRFGAFYALGTALWRRRAYEAHHALIDKYEASYKDHALYSVLEAEYYLSRSTNEGSLDIALVAAGRAMLELKNVPGVLILNAEIIATQSELSITPARALVQDGERLATRAIALAKVPYAKHFAIRARLRLLLHSYDRARDDIRLAIELEPRDTPDYGLRTTGYQLTEFNIGLMEQASRLRAKQAAAITELQSVKGQTLELLGLLAAVIAFVVTGSQIATGYAPSIAVALFVAIGGVIVLTFSAFALLFSHAGSSRVRVGLALAIGVAMLGSGAAFLAA